MYRAYPWYIMKEMDKIITDCFQALLARKIEIFLAHCISVVSL